MLISSLPCLAAAEYDQGNFQGFGSCGSALTVVHFIMAGLQAGCEALVDFIHTNAGLNFDYELHSVPLVVVPENGSRSEPTTEQQI
jgi:hypothetical protein